MVCKKMAVQFTLSRMFQLVAVVAVVCSLFATVAFPWAVLLLAEMNGVACIGFLYRGEISAFQVGWSDVGAGVYGFGQFDSGPSRRRWL